MNSAEGNFRNTIDGDYEFQFTVFTPTYKSAETLHRPFESLKQQTFSSFEWMIVDDSPTNETAKLVEEFAQSQEASFPIRYFKGLDRYGEPSKPRAHNLGIEKARGKLFLPLDSDDECIPQALERFYYHWKSIPNKTRQRYSGVTSLCQDQDGNIVGDLFPAPVVDMSAHEMHHVLHRKGERWGFQRTDLLKQHPFPTPSGVKFIPEGVVWSELAEEYVLRHVNEPLRIYWREETDSLMDTTSPAEYATGHTIWHRTILQHELQPRYFQYHPSYFLRSGAYVSRFCLHANWSLYKQFSALDSPIAKLLWLICLPVGIAIYLRDCLIYDEL